MARNIGSAIDSAPKKIAQEMQVEDAQGEPPDLHPILRPIGKDETDEEPGQQAMGEHMVPTPIGFYPGQDRQTVKI